MYKKKFVERRYASPSRLCNGCEYVATKKYSMQIHANDKGFHIWRERWGMGKDPWRHDLYLKLCAVVYIEMLH